MPRFEVSAFPPRTADSELLCEGGVNVFHSLRFGSPRFAEDCSTRFADDAALGAENVRVPWLSALRLAELFISRPALGVPAFGFPPEAAVFALDSGAPRDSIVALRPPAVTGLT
jgi:hypothetical protein